MRRLSRLAGLLAALMLLAGCQREPTLWQQESYVFGTRVQITTADVPENVARPAVAAALADLDRWHVRLHAWRDDSELTRINRALAAGQPVDTDSEVLGLLRQAQDMSARADGLFNPAIGQLVALWGFHADSFAPVRPEPGALARLFADIEAAGVNVEDVRIEHDPAREVGYLAVQVTKPVAKSLQAAMTEAGWTLRPAESL